MASWLKSKLTSSSALAERPCELGDYKGVGHFEVKFLGRRVMCHANIYGPLDGGMVIPQLCRWKFSHKETLQQTLFD